MISHSAQFALGRGTVYYRPDSSILSIIQTVAEAYRRVDHHDTGGQPEDD